MKTIEALDEPTSGSRCINMDTPVDLTALNKLNAMTDLNVFGLQFYKYLYVFARRSTSTRILHSADKYWSTEM